MHRGDDKFAGLRSGANWMNELQDDAPAMISVHVTIVEARLFVDSSGVRAGSIAWQLVSWIFLFKTTRPSFRQLRRSALLSNKPQGHQVRIIYFSQSPNDTDLERNSIIYRDTLYVCEGEICTKFVISHVRNHQRRKSRCR